MVKKNITNIDNRKEPIKPILIYSFATPVAVLYIVLLSFTEASMVSAALGYVTLGLAFGLLQSIFTIEKPYKVAFLSVASAPLLAYSFVALIGVLLSLGIIAGIPLEIPQVSGGALPIVATPYIQRLGTAGGIILYVIVIGLLIIPFGLTGIAGRFLGESLSKGISRFESQQHLQSSPSKKGTTKQKELAIEKLKVIATIIAAVISATTSIVIAFAK